jgi:hypothetical protein
LNPNGNRLSVCSAFRRDAPVHERLQGDDEVVPAFGQAIADLDGRGRHDRAGDQALGLESLITSPSDPIADWNWKDTDEPRKKRRPRTRRLRRRLRLAGVYDALKADGYNVAIVQNPTLSLEGDVAATHQVIDVLPGPVTLVGHSCGGAVITEAGNHKR